MQHDIELTAAMEVIRFWATEKDLKTKFPNQTFHSLYAFNRFRCWIGVVSSTPPDKLSSTAEFITILTPPSHHGRELTIDGQKWIFGKKWHETMMPYTIDNNTPSA